MTKKKHKTTTGALPNSAGFPGSNMTNNSGRPFVEFTIPAATFYFYDGMKKSFNKLKFKKCKLPYHLIGVR